MGLMFSRRRAESAKEEAANKSKAHNENHRRALAADKAGKHPAEIQKQEVAPKSEDKKPSEK